MKRPHGLRSSSPHFGRLPYLLATTCGLGDILPAPGTTAGSLPAIVLWFALARWVEPTILGPLTAGLAGIAAVIGVWASGTEAQRRGREDPGAVVVDEVAGQWLTCLIALPWAPLTKPSGALGFAAAAFILFRVFDVLKPWPIRRLETLPGGWGIVADDLAAGVEAGLVLILCLMLWGH